MSFIEEQTRGGSSLKKLMSRYSDNIGRKTNERDIKQNEGNIGSKLFTF